MGLVLDKNDKKVELEFRMNLIPPSLKFTVYLMDRFVSHTLNSERFDFKSRANPEDLDSRREWYSADSTCFIGDVFVVEPIDSRGKMIEISVKVSWDPCYAVIQWVLGDCHMHVATRPSPPYRTWVRDNVGPVTWNVAVNHADRVLAKSISSRKPDVHESSSSSAQPPVPRISQDQFCQTQVIHVRENFCQTVLPSFAHCGVGPDLIHLETRLVPFYPIQYFHPPWPIVWVHVVDAFGVIHDTVWTMPTPVEEEILANQFPPETTHETEYVFPTNALIPRRPPPFVKRPPPPPFTRPMPPDERPGYIPIPQGIRAVFTTGAVLLRSQPEMNHPRRVLAPRIRDGVNALSDMNVVGIAQHWARRTDLNPEINPHI